MTETWQERYRHKLVGAAEAVARIGPGQRIFLGSGAAEPALLVQALVDHGQHLRDNEIVHILTLGPAPYVAESMRERFHHTAFFIGQNVREAVQSGRADFVPVFLSELPTLIRTRRVRVDVALIQTTPPDERGHVSVGVSLDVVQAALDSAGLVIAQVNPRMPRTLGASQLPVSKLSWLVEGEAPLFELVPEPPDPVARAIGEHVATLVPNGATLQAGIGRIPNAILEALGTREDLGVHTEMLSDGLMKLAVAGVVTGLRKTLRPGRMVTSFVMGSRELYAWVDQNPQVELQPSDFTNDPSIIAQNTRMIAVNSAISVDLTGQVAADTLEGKFFSGIGGQVDFIRGAAKSPGGKPIIALPSTARGGRASRIVSTLEPGAGVVTSRGDVHYVVTEYGVAQLWGKSVRERSTALLEIAHPDVRADLLNEAKKRHYVLPDQPLPNALPIRPARVETLSSGDRISVRAALISDEDALQDVLYGLGDESTFLRFFGHSRVHPREHVLRMIEADGTNGIALIATQADRGDLLGLARADRAPRSSSAELSVLVTDEWQRHGIGRVLLQELILAAQRAGISSLFAEVLPQNHGMQRLLRRFDFQCRSNLAGDPYTFTLQLGTRPK